MTYKSRVLIHKQYIIYIYILVHITSRHIYKFHFIFFSQITEYQNDPWVRWRWRLLELNLRRPEFPRSLRPSITSPWCYKAHRQTLAAVVEVAGAQHRLVAITRVTWGGSVAVKNVDQPDVEIWITGTAATPFIATRLECSDEIVYNIIVICFVLAESTSIVSTVTQECSSRKKKWSDTSNGTKRGTRACNTVSWDTRQATTVRTDIRDAVTTASKHITIAFKWVVVTLKYDTST